MRERRAGRLSTWLRDRRRVLFFGLISVCFYAIYFYLALWFPVPPGDYVDSTRLHGVAMAFFGLAGTALVGLTATAPMTWRGREAPLPRVVAWGMLAPLVAECSIVWFALHDDIGRSFIFIEVALALDAVGALGAFLLRKLQTPPPASDAPTAPSGPPAPISGS